jgi:DNA modification methylase
VGTEILTGDCVEVMAAMAPASVDAVVCDPPYELGFMGKSWDGTGVAYQVATWRAAYRVLKPGGHLLAFGGSRTYHRMACAVEDAGFEIRDQIMWLYGSGFPKSSRVNRNPMFCQCGEDGRSGESNGCGFPLCQVCGKPIADGWGTALKPAHEPIVVARKPLIGTVAANVQKHGTGALNVDGCRIGSAVLDSERRESIRGASEFFGLDAKQEGARHNPQGRWPANVILDEEAGAMLDEQSGERPGMSGGGTGRRDNSMFGVGGITKPETVRGDTGGASRFFYCPKASRKEREAGCEMLREVVAKRTQDGGDDTQGRPTPRNRNHHPTVKPVELMRYLIRLVTPPGGTVLDPFLGSGTTLMAAVMEGVNAIGIEREAEYVEIAKARVAWAESQPVQTTLEPSGPEKSC